MVPSVYGPKQDYEHALAFVESKLEPGDVVVTTGMTTMPFQEYLKRTWPSVSTEAELDSVQHRAARTWLMYAFPPHMETVHPDINARVKRDFEVAARFGGTLGGGEILVLVSRNTKP